MKKNSDTPTQTAADSETISPAAPVKPRRHVGLLAVFSISTIILLGSASYILVSKQSLQMSQTNHTQQIQEELAKLAQQQRMLSDSLKSTNELIQSKQTDQQEQLNALLKKIESNRTLDATQKQPWLLKKARYYLELAQMNAQWSNNQEYSIMLLQEAEALLQKIPDERLYSIKQKIAEETAALKSIPPVDVAGLMKHLDKAQATVVQLPFKPLKLTPTLQATQNSWSKHWQSSLALLEKLIIVRHHKQGEAPTLTPLYQLVLRERISMDLQEAQWAVLQSNSKLYHQALARVIKGIQHGFATKEADTTSTNQASNRSKVDNFLTQIHQLQQVELVSTKPDITQSLAELDEIISSSSSSIMTRPKSNTSSPQQGSYLP